MDEIPSKSNMAFCDRIVGGYYTLECQESFGGDGDIRLDQGALAARKQESA
jgi:hypothetical protein